MTKISWTEKVWNPVAGCTRASEGCDRCYAFMMTKRLASMGKQDYAGLTGNGHFNGIVRELPHKLRIPIERKKPTMYFVNSMSDLFHAGVSDEFVDMVFAVMASCPQHTFQVLTKRPERMAEYMGHRNRLDKVYDVWYEVNDHPREAAGWPLPNVWLGTSVENQEQAEKRIPHLLRVPAAVRFLSCEPLLGPVSIDDVFPGGLPCPVDGPYTRAIHWVIAGAESGHGARPMDLDWVRSLRDQCQAAGVPFFLKQVVVNGRKIELPELDGKVWAEMPVMEYA